MKRAILAALLVGCLSNEGIAQQARKEPIFPDHPTENQWYFDPLLHKAWIYQDQDWTQYPCDDVRSITSCNGHTILKCGFQYMLAKDDGTLVVFRSPSVRCMEGFVLLNAGNRVEYLLNQKGDTVSAMIDNCKISFDTVQGQRVYCFPRYSVGLERHNCSDLRNWGMMNAEGDWLIEPSFDKPFRFVNGRAAVWYKGMLRAIDENGTFLTEE